MGIFNWLFKRKKKVENIESELSCQTQTEENSLEIQFNALQEGENVDESKLVLIKDERLIERITSIAPTLLQLVQTSNLVGETKKLTAEPVYKAIIPKGVSLASSSAIKGAKRGIYFDKNNKLGHANLQELDNAGEKRQRGTKLYHLYLAFASLVVGQYYMTKINGKLDEIADNLGRIYSFLSNEYLSKITATIKQVKEIAEYQISSLENKETCIEEQRKLNNLKEKTTELLDQANLSINELTQQNVSGFKEYVSKTNEIETWRKYQLVLTEILYQICSLNYVFSLEQSCKEKAFSVFNQCNVASGKISEKLIEYHKKHQEEFKISLDKQTISNGKIVEFIARVIGKEEWKERQIAPETATMFLEQMKPFESRQIDKDLTEEQDVVLISKQGYLYYLPSVN